MKNQRPLPEEFLAPLHRKEEALVTLYTELRNSIFDRYPEVNELLYHTHALTSVFTVSEKMNDGFCLIPIYKEHFNLGFQRGTVLVDSSGLLTGTGKLMRHIPITGVNSFKKDEVVRLLDEAYKLALEDAAKVDLQGKTISKIKK